jgi:hypothetical protein
MIGGHLMNVSKVTHQVKLDRWTAILKEQNSSGLSIKDWCSQNGIKRDQFFYWKRKLKESVLESALPEIVPVSLPTLSSDCTTCKTCTTSQLTNTDFLARITIQDVYIELGSGATEQLISGIIKAVRNA